MTNTNVRIASPILVVYIQTGLLRPNWSLMNGKNLSKGGNGVHFRPMNKPFSTVGERFYMPASSARSLSIEYLYTTTSHESKMR
jgi:hypothetical protein